MLLKEAIHLHNQHKGKTDILELLGIEIREDYQEETYYSDKIERLETGNYFISDLDGTFFRGMLSQEVFSLFFKYIKRQNILDYDINKFSEFLVDGKYFDQLEKDAYNKKIKYGEYINAGTFLLFKYKELIHWDNFLAYLYENFSRKEKVNPFRFSIYMMKKILNDGGYFCFVSGAPHFVLEIYLDLLKKHLSEEFKEEQLEKIIGFGSYISVTNSHAIGLFGKEHKERFIQLLKDTGKIVSIDGGMGDTKSDFGISVHVESGQHFYFVNPEQSVIEKRQVFEKKDVQYHYIIERKNLIFEMNPEDIEVIEIKKR